MHLIRSIVEDVEWPLVDLLATDEEGEHAARCQTSCYRCIQRYGNRPYHGLLDWRLGLAYLRAMVTPGYTCGLSAHDARHPEIGGGASTLWRSPRPPPGCAREHSSAGVHAASGLPCLFEQGRSGPGSTIVVIHPLWSTDGNAGLALAGGEG